VRAGRCDVLCINSRGVPFGHGRSERNRHRSISESIVSRRRASKPRCRPSRMVRKNEAMIICLVCYTHSCLEHRSPRPSDGVLSACMGRRTRKVVNYAVLRRSRGKLRWKSVAVLTCKLCSLSCGMGAKGQSNHLVAGFPRSFPQDSWTRTPARHRIQKKALKVSQLREITR